MVFWFTVTDKHKIIYIQLYITYHTHEKKTIRLWNTEYLLLRVECNHYRKYFLSQNPHAYSHENNQYELINILTRNKWKKNR